MTSVINRLRLLARLLFFPSLLSPKNLLFTEVPGFEDSTFWMASFSFIISITNQVISGRSIELYEIVSMSLFIPFLILCWLWVVDVSIKKLWRLNNAGYEKLLYAISSLFVLLVSLTLVLVVFRYFLPEIPNSIYDMVAFYVIFLSILSVRFVTGLGFVRSSITVIISSIVAPAIAAPFFYAFTRILFGLSSLVERGF